MSAAPELDAYFARIGYTGPRTPALSTLHALTAAHTSTIPFENLAILMGEPIDLEVEALFAKLVHARRGGYCFEQTHVFLRVELEGESWLTDVGVGGVSLTSAIRLDADGEQATPHESRRIVREGARLFHQVRFGDEWEDVCEFTLEEMPPIDRELGNWFTSAHPRSHFKNRLIVARAAAEGARLTLLNDELKIRRRDGHATSRAIKTPDELLEVLEQHFGLRFPAGTRFGPPGSPWPR